MKPHESIRLFNNPLLEALTHVHPSIPFLIWVPIVAYSLLRSFALNDPTAAILLVFSGLLFWTLTEYAMHRYVFHFQARSKAGQYLVYLFHGIHHEDPEDPTRLVMPPVVSLVLGGLFFVLFNLILGPARSLPFFAGFISGYLVYDYIHFATHHFRMRSAWGKALKENHMKHHYLKKGGKWGVSSTLWDHVFGTFEGR
ncbi:fatty acid hydroxylase [bacterium]|jgi:sterol desaturase/sphingolipid hydroxylase (fatty acid hydroxylase superfamily)|nr:fatty acid hydroxylase [bacterium]